MRPHARHHAVIVLGVALGLAGLPAHAQKPGRPFKSPLKNFTVIVPDFPFGTKVEKQNTEDGGTVSFLGPAGHLSRIDYQRLPVGAVVPADSVELFQLHRQALAALLQANPCSLVADGAHTIDGAATLSAVVAFPAGSHLRDAASGRRMDSVRGVLAFARGGFVYLLHVELAANVFNRPNAPPPAVEELRRRAQQFLTGLYRAMTFP
jgi:hypothetical protein